MPRDPAIEEDVRRRLRERGAADYIVREAGDGLIRRWRKFVDEVAAGYPLGLDDYRNDLDIRTLIHVAGLDAEVAPEDARLRSLLAHTDTRIWESDAPDPFWIYGFPRNASGELAEDLRAAGFIR